VSAATSKRCGGRKAQGEWAWAKEYHGDGELVELPTLEVTTGTTKPRSYWTFHDAYCGIGNVQAGFELAGGKCTGAFDACSRARVVYDRRFGAKALDRLGMFELDQMGPADVYYGAPPCEGKAFGQGVREARQMWQQLQLVDKFQYKMRLFEVLSHFKRMEQGTVFRDFAVAMQSRGYQMHWKSLFCPDYGSAAARRRIVLVGIKDELHARGGEFRYPDPCSSHHPLYSVLEPDFFRRSVRVGNRGFVPLPEEKQKTKNCLRQVGT
jgi:site-specific DNA-cytosine methylase